MSRRVSLPGADELFRAAGTSSSSGQVTPLRHARAPAPATGEIDESTTVTASGRTAHDAKITVYLTQDELLELEQARLLLRGRFGIAVDRGRLVREALADLLADLRTAGPDAAVVRRLS